MCAKKKEKRESIPIESKNDEKKNERKVGGNI